MRVHARADDGAPPRRWLRECEIEGSALLALRQADGERARGFRSARHLLEVDALRDALDELDRRDPARAPLVAWSGTLAASLFDAEPGNWMVAGGAAMASACERLRPHLDAAKRTLLLEPHARHILSDVRGTRSFLADRRGEPFAIALAPASLLERSMLERVEEHLERMFEGLGAQAAFVILEDVRPGADGEDAALERVALGHGVLPRERLLELVERWVPAATPVVMR